MSSISEHLDPKQNSLWWLRNAVKTANMRHQKELNGEIELTSPNKLEINISSSVEELFENEEDYSASFEDVSETDIGSIIDEINKIASQSPIGTYENPVSDKSVEEILKEAEKLYMESSKSFEQLSTRSKTPIEFSIPKSKSSISFKSLKKSTPSPVALPVLEKLNLPSDRTDKSFDSDRTEIQSPEDEEVNLLWEKENEDVLNIEKPPSELSINLNSLHDFEDRINEAEKIKENIDELLEENINELKDNLEEFTKEESSKVDNNLDNNSLELHEDSNVQDEAINMLHLEIDNLKEKQRMQSASRSPIEEHMRTQESGDGEFKTYSGILKAALYGDKEVVKKECIEHVQKRIGTRLRCCVKKMWKPLKKLEKPYT